MFESPTIHYVDATSPNGIVFGGGALKRIDEVLEGKAPYKGIIL